MPVDMRLFLQNVQAALVNKQYEHARFLLDAAVNLAVDDADAASPTSLDVGIGLHPGRIRDRNEDCLFAVSGVNVLEGTNQSGLYVVCDGMGGHAHGQEAACLAIQTIAGYVLPLLISHASSRWEDLLVDGILQANRAIYLRNRSREQHVASEVPMNTSQIHHMGTTVTAVLLVDETAYVANVGDSRTYLYDQSLKRITRDHSLVAQFFADGLLQQEEDIYVHPQRNQITRALGAKPTVVVDTFVIPLHGNETLLLCSDGLWEMVRDRLIEEVLSSPTTNASSMANRLVQLANERGGADNIGCIVLHLQKQTDISALKTALLDPVAHSHH